MTHSLLFIVFIPLLKRKKYSDWRQSHLHILYCNSKNDTCCKLTLVKNAVLWNQKISAVVCSLWKKKNYRNPDSIVDYYKTWLSRLLADCLSQIESRVLTPAMHVRNKTLLSKKGGKKYAALWGSYSVAVLLPAHTLSRPLVYSLICLYSDLEGLQRRLLLRLGR